MTIHAYLSLAVSSETAALPAVRATLRRWLTTAEVDDAAARDIVLAAWEACANAAEHPVQAATGELTLEAWASGTDVSLSVSDTGRWRRRRGRRSERGLGLLLVRALMDDVSICRTSDGTEVRMRRSLAAGASATRAGGRHPTGFADGREG